MADEPGIQAVIAGFFAAFDNRDRAPDGADLRALLTDDARIRQVTPDGVRTMDVDAFLAPRLALLSGRLQAFHEWPTTGYTDRHGSVASHVCRYAKEGLLDGAPYAGTGWKAFQLVRNRRTTSVPSVRPSISTIGFPCRQPCGTPKLGLLPRLRGVPAC
ncbi:MAG: DUF4440 domain-containing protein [Myxococcota bacterium]